MFKMLIGITFLTVIADIILSDNDYKKYVKSVIGIFVVIIVIQGFLGIKTLKIDYSIIEDIEKEVKKNTLILQDDIVSEMLSNVKREIILRLKKDNIELNELVINTDENLNIISVVIRLENEEFNEKAVNIISKEFNIDKNVIETG